MKDHPILFSAPMVRALLDGSKTQTRRVVKTQPVRGQGMVSASYCGFRNLWLRDGPCSKTDPAKEWRCPYGQPGGDRLWVKETHWRDDEDGDILYAANPDDFEIVNHNKRATGFPRFNWKPSIFMRREYSRITLEIVSVRVERLQDISGDDCFAEGSPGGHGSIPGYPYAATAQEHYEWLWKSINGDASWAANPWVWVVEFRRIEP
jgi:hypothetical protein